MRCVVWGVSLGRWVVRCVVWVDIVVAGVVCDVGVSLGRWLVRCVVWGASLGRWLVRCVVWGASLGRVMPLGVGHF